MERKIDLYSVQDDFVHSQSVHSAFIGGVGSGKTLAGSVKALIRASNPNTLGMIVSPTFGMLRDSTLRVFKDLAGDAIRNINKQEMVAYIRGGGEVLLRSADNPEHLRGPNLHWAWIDEGGLTREDTYDITLGRLRAGGKNGDLWITTTPKGKLNWVYRASQEMPTFKATTLDNPFVSDDWKETLLKRYKGKFLQQEVYAEFVSFEGLVYPMFDASQHVQKKDTSEFVEVGLAVDEGYTNPAVILKVYHDRLGGLHIGEEFYKSGKLQTDLVREIARMAGADNPTIIVDAAAASLIAAIRNEGFVVRGGKGRVMEGIRKVQSRIADGGLTIDPSCVNTINEFESYIFKEGKDEPMKEFDHSMDALRYYVTMLERFVPAVAKQTRW